MAFGSPVARLARAFAFLALVIAPFGLLAEESSSHKEGGLVFATPAGWSKQDGGEHIVVSYIPPVQNDVILEVRRLEMDDNGTAVLFSESFHTQLRHAGLRTENRVALTEISKGTGLKTTYRALAATGAYRMVVAEFRHGQSYWIISGFFDERRFDSFLRIFNRFLETIVFET